MEKFKEPFIVIITIVFAIFFSAVISGTLLWALYPQIHTLFPTAAAKGIIARDISWWSAVCLSWIFAILLKSTTTVNK